MFMNYWINVIQKQNKKLVKRKIFLMVICLLVSLSLQAQTTEFEQTIQNLGLTDIKHDWSTEKKVTVPEPECAYVNITGVSSMPQKKKVNLKAWLEFYDGFGNYFKKHVILNAQGKKFIEVGQEEYFC